VGWTVVALRELSVGLALGMAARIVFSGIEGAAGLVAGQAGFAFASMVDPLSGEQGLATTLFLNLLSTTLFLAADLHHLFILGLKHSYSVLPPAVALPATSGLAEIVAVLGQRVFTIAVELAAPALVVTLAVDLVMALVGRAAPQLQILTVGYPAKMAMGLVAISILAASTGTAIGWIGKTFASDGARILSALAAK
jgi:flagellar biosynthetic protein FliR